MTQIAARREKFRQLHEKGCFVIPNPWDVGTARYLTQLGFPALATTSSGFAFTRGLPDDPAVGVSRDMMLVHIHDIVEGVDVPVNADFMNGYADEPEGVAENVTRCVATGVAGVSIEDSTGGSKKPLYDLELAVERIRAARAAIDATGTGVLLTARAECHLVGHPDPLNESIRRLQAYAEAGADVLYAPGLPNRDAMVAVVKAVAPRPVNILMSTDIGMTVADVAATGARRISVGSSLARAAWNGVIRAAKLMASEGKFTGLAGNVPFAELNGFFEKR
jgi:2-methylisocitrate lyase-like PEP mutase family enzyme